MRLIKWIKKLAYVICIHLGSNNTDLQMFLGHPYLDSTEIFVINIYYLFFEMLYKHFIHILYKALFDILLKDWLNT